METYFLKDGVELPKKGNYYVVGSNGTYLHKDTGLIEATVRVEGVPFLKEIKPEATLRLTKLSLDLMARSLFFFRRVYEEHQSEAIVLLHYCSKTETYLLHCPKQTVGCGSVSYDSDERFDGYQLVGTIHSHSNMGAFHSGTDDHDEKHFDGLHITIGDLGQPHFTVSCSVVVNGQRFIVPPDDIATGIKEVDWKPKAQTSFFPKRAPKVQLGEFLDPGWLGFDDSFNDFGLEEETQFYDIDLPERQDYNSLAPPESWLDLVTKLKPVIWGSTVPVEKKLIQIPSIPWRGKPKLEGKVNNEH